MTYRTINVSLNDIAGHEALFAAAVFLGRTFAAHIAGIYVIPRPQYHASGGLDPMPVVLDSIQTFFRDKAKATRAAFEAAMGKEGISYSFAEIEGPDSDVASGVVAESMCADLILCKQVDEMAGTGIESGFVEHIVMSAGRPVLVLPDKGNKTLQAGEAIVGWNGSRESARAAFDALPLLMAADRVRVTVVDPQKIEKVRGRIPGADLAESLARHGVKASAEGYPTNGAEPGMALLEHARDTGASLVVMGAYGHSRLREFILGGATNSVLGQMDRPVLMSH